MPVPLRTEHLAVAPHDPDPRVLEQAGRLLRDGRLVAFPTETVYGLGADAGNEDAVRALFAAKGRPADNPLIVHVADPDMVSRVARDVPGLAKRLMDAFWPGPLTLVLPRRDGVPDVTTAGLDTVGVRLPDHPVARALLAAAEVPLAAPSANRSGSPSPTTAAHVLADLDGRIDMVLDAGPCRIGLESTVVQVVDDGILVLRLGAITREMLAAHGSVRVHPHAAGLRATTTEPVPSPGMKHRHYAPHAAVRLFEGPDRVERLDAAYRHALETGQDVGLIVTTESGLSGEHVVPIASRAQPEEYARRLYSTLRAFDAQGIALILLEGIEPVGVGAAVMDRMRRAAAG